MNCSLGNYRCTRGEEVTSPAAGEVGSPDGRWSALVREHNLYLRNERTGEVFAVSSDGEPYYDYAGISEASQRAATLRRLGRRPTPVVVWSPDSRRLLTHRIDQREVGELALIQASPPDSGRRPRIFPYRMALPGDRHVARTELWVFSTEGYGLKLDVEPFTPFTLRRSSSGSCGGVTAAIASTWRARSAASN
jgi:dipeptidyl-peptidase 4